MVNKLVVLMWKHFVVRRRRFIHTAIEYLSPIVFFILLFAFRNKLNPPSKYSQRSDAIHYTESLSIDDLHAPLTIFYIPDTITTRLLMHNVGVKLMLPPGNAATGKGYFPIAREADIPRTATNFGILKFHNLGGQEYNLPGKLNYTIRLGLPYRYIANRIDEGEVLDQHPAYGIIYEPFVRLQWAVDSTFLELKSNASIPQRVSLQEFAFASAETNPSARMLINVLSVAAFLSLGLPFVFLASRLLSEKANGMREMVRMVGVPSQLLHLSHLLNTLPVGALYTIVGGVFCVVGEDPLLRNTSVVVIFIMLFLTYVSLMIFAFVISCFLNNEQYAMSFSMLMYIVMRLPGQMLSEYVKWSWPVAGLFPSMPLKWYWTNVAEFEAYGQGSTLSNLMSTAVRHVPPVFICIMLAVVQILLFTLLLWYLDQVFPGPYGQAVPWNFLCKVEYWKKTQVNPIEELEELESDDPADSRYFEPLVEDAEAGIKVVNVSKVFPKMNALSNVTLNAYKGEITVLLGHNGAGKTTLMSIISGLISATHGKVYVSGLDTATQTEQMRHHLGLCPQHNLFFSDLTVLEHTMFYTLLKGATFANAKDSSMKLLTRLGLEDKAHNNSSQLSGGMKRRLQLACALAGDADVLVLDEPTAGLDVETRRELWDLILSLRGQHTVLLSTHFMEEADALGDRVAALQGGHLRCYATPMFLKRAIGTGHRLTLTTHGAPNEPALTPVVTSHLPDAVLKERTPNTISYNLPAADVKRFPGLFNDLEKRKAELGIDSIGVGVTTLEEVFLKLCSNVTADFTEDEVDKATGAPKSNVKAMYTGPTLYLRQFCVLFKRQFEYLWSNKYSFLILQVVLPLLVIAGSIFISNEIDGVEAPQSEVSMSLDLYKNVDGRRALYALSPAALRSGAQLYPGVKATYTNDVADEILRIGIKDIREYNKYLIGVEINDTDARFHFTTVRHHAAPVAANTMSNILAMQILRTNDPHTITTNNMPLITSATPEDVKEPKSILPTAYCVWVTVTVIMSTLCSAASLPCAERVTSARNLHILMGARPLVLWAATLTAHLLTYTLVLLLPALVAYAAIDAQSTLDQPDFLGVMWLSLTLGAAAVLAFMYLFTFCFTYSGVSLIMIPIVILFGIITPALSTGLKVLGDKGEKGFLYYLLGAGEYIVPPHAFAGAALKAGYVAHTNALANLNPHKDLPRLCYMCFEGTAPGPHVLVLFCQFLVYMVLVVVAQYGVFQGLWERLFTYREPPPAAFTDSMVVAEEAYVKQAIDRPKHSIPDALLAHDLHKMFPKVMGKPCHAVKGVSFSVKKGECFGLLGVNGAGKSTIFKMLTGSERPTRGTAFAHGYRLDKNYHQYLRSLGYCPQFSGLDEFLTGAQNLRLLLTLRGLGPSDVAAETRTWIEAVGLEKYAARAVREYSGGCARRMAAAAALCAGSRVMLLDEPSAGVDVGARRRLWAAVRRAARASAVIISSHSMDETEALCGRIAIVSAGRVRALGSAGALRAAHAAGHAVVLRVSQPRTDARDKDETDSVGSEMKSLKHRLHETFDCTLRDEHKTMLHYHINETMAYSDLFAKLERLRAEFPAIQDYSVSETTLEEVFLSFAREADGVGTQTGPTSV